eukprot:5095347-Pyramimonas_sp.AAC.1
MQSYANPIRLALGTALIPYCLDEKLDQNMFLKEIVDRPRAASCEIPIRSSAERAAPYTDPQRPVYDPKIGAACRTSDPMQR